jgi:diaminopimelate epimerase
MRVPFAKMHGVGNDFMVLRWPEGRPLPTPAQIRAWADRRRGVGFDQFLLIESAAPTGAVAAYRVYNADGTEVQQCGNGARCIARFLALHGAPREMRLASQAGPVEARVVMDGEVAVSLGVPNFSPGALPFLTEESADPYHLEVAGRRIEFGIVSMGNPHAVLFVDSVDHAPVGILGPALGAHAAFPEGVNVGFAEFVHRGKLRLRVYERGAGETLACGTGAAAAVAVGRRRGRLDAEVEVSLPGGDLTVSWPEPDAALWLAGPASLVYEGEISI